MKIYEATNQPLKFTQIDIETTFLTPEEIQTYTENMLAEVMKENCKKELRFLFRFHE